MKSADFWQNIYAFCLKMQKNVQKCRFGCVFGHFLTKITHLYPLKSSVSRLKSSAAFSNLSCDEIYVSRTPGAAENDTFCNLILGIKLFAQVYTPEYGLCYR